MQKLKKKQFNKLLNYQQFLKNNYLKTNKFNLKKILFENKILYKSSDSNVLELNNYENIYLPFTLLNLKDTYTIKNQYENQFLFNFYLNKNNKFKNKKNFHIFKKIKSKQLINSYKLRYINFKIKFILNSKFKN